MTELKAPGAMSQPALRDELAERTTFTKDYIDLLSWPELIKHVEEARMNDVHLRGKPMFLGMPDTKDFLFDGHAGAGPSGAERWMNCTGALEMAREFLETLTPHQQREFAEGSEAARQGTTAHSVGEVKIRHMMGEVDDAELDATLLELALVPDEGEAYDDDMAEYVEEYVDLIGTFVQSGRRVEVEARLSAAVPLTLPWKPGDVHVITGSGDTAVYPSEEEPELDIIDLKFGNGIDVGVEENPQIRIYGLGLLGELADDEGNLPNIERINYWIVQPRLGGIKQWSETIDELLTWRDEVLSPALSLALAGRKGGASLSPSETACTWCPARGSCSALIESRFTEAHELFDTIIDSEMEGETFPETGSLSDADLGRLYGQVLGLIDLKDDLKSEVTRRMHRGDKVPGFKMVSYSPPRQWTEQAAEELEDEDRLWARKLITPTQALKVVGDDPIKTTLEGMITKPDKRPVIAPIGDRRKEWEGNPPEQMFADLGEEDVD